MSRFAYIPLNFDNITLGIERELSIKRDTKDLFILDDYKVPVSATANIRELFEKNDIVAHNVLDDTIQLEIRHKSYIKEISNLGYEIDKLIESFNNETFNRIEALGTYQKYLNTRFIQIDKTYNLLKSELEVTFNSYKENLNTILEMIETRYNQGVIKVATYNAYCLTYNQMITEMEHEVQTLFDTIKSKVVKLGTGSGSYSGSKTVSTTKKVRLITMFRWLSNNTSTYPGHDYKWYNYSTSPPDNPNNFGAGKLSNDSTISSWVREWDSTYYGSMLEAVKDFRGDYNGGTPVGLHSLWWNGGVISGPTNSWEGFISESGIFNQYGKEVYLCYYKDVTVNTTEYFYHNVT